jgi:hypothetical protein
MKIQSINEVIEPVHYVTTDEEGYCDYRRYSDDSWEVAVGESWKSVYVKGEILEILFQEFLKARK